MGQRKREAAELRSLNRMIWGASVYDRHVAQSRAERAARRARRTSGVSIGLGVILLAAAAIVFVLPRPAFAHESEINISCTQVTFNYQSFADASTTAHESITVDNDAPMQHEFTFTGAQATDTVPLSLSPGTHTVHATDAWDSADGGGSAQAQQTLTDCTPPPTTSTSETTPTTVGPTTTIAPTTTTLVTTTTRPTTTTTSETPITPLGSTSTTATPITPLATASTTSTTSPRGPITTFATPATPATPTGQLANTGSSSNTSLAVAIGMVGLGLLAAGLGRRRAITIPD